MSTPTIDWFALSPVLALLAASATALLGSVLLPPGWRRPFAFGVTAAGFAVSLGLAIAVFADSDEPQLLISDTMVRDRWAALAQAIIAGAGLLATLISWSEPVDSEHTGEYYAVLAAAAAGMAFFVAANNLMLLFLALEWFSISLYVLCAIHGGRATSLEAGLKYLIVGSFGSAILLFGAALVYGATGELEFGAVADAAAADDLLYVAGLALILAGIAFKASAAPFHMWTPDVYQGAPTPVTAFMSAATKVAALVLALRLLLTAFPEQSDFWAATVAAIAVASLAVGNLAALVQRDLKRMLAYSSVSHAGFMLIPIAAASDLGARALMYYLIPYAAMSVGAFAVVAARERELGRAVDLDALSGMGWERPFLGVAMAVFMFGFIGLPTGGLFLGKIYVLAAAYEDGWTWLVIAGVIATAVSVYYYLAPVRALYMRAPELRTLPAGGAPAPRDALLHGGVAAALVVTVGSFFAVQPLIELARDAAAALPF